MVHTPCYLNLQITEGELNINNTLSRNHPLFGTQGSLHLYFSIVPYTNTLLFFFFLLYSTGLSAD